MFSALQFPNWFWANLVSCLLGMLYFFFFNTIKKLGHEADNLLLSDSKIKKVYGTILSLPHTFLWCISYLNTGTYIPLPL